MASGFFLLVLLSLMSLPKDWHLVFFFFLQTGYLCWLATCSFALLSSDVSSCLLNLNRRVQINGYDFSNLNMAEPSYFINS